MFDDEEIEGGEHQDDAGGEGGEPEAKGDGLHHHEIHEDEGGGYVSKHTHPDGRVEHGEHTTYEEARDHMDAMHGHEEPDGDEPDEDGDEGPDVTDIAGSYGRQASRG